jgi:hypothetical protein
MVDFQRAFSERKMNFNDIIKRRLLRLFRYVTLNAVTKGRVKFV